MIPASDVQSLAQDLIRIDTSNDPRRKRYAGGALETPAAEHLGAYLANAGVEVELVARDPGRANLVARIPGEGSGPSLALVGHTDVVPADPGGWTHPPFAAVIDDDGYLHGRGSLDMKGELAARAVAMATLASEGFRPCGDLWLLAVADEEDGSADVGMRWLLEERPDIRPVFAVNEGGGELLRLANGRSLLTISVGEKGTAPARVTALGEAGHASRPNVGESAVASLAQLLLRIGSGMPSPGSSLPWLDDALRVILDVAPADPATAIAAAAALHPNLAASLPPLLGSTMAPTMLCASPVRNVIPNRASVELDCRLLPGTTVDELEADVRERLGSDLRYEITWPEPPVPGTSSPSDSALVAAATAFARERDPNIEMLPLLDSGFTDSVHLRAVAGTLAYGFNPYLHTPGSVLMNTVHNADERVHVDDLAVSVDFHVFLARRLLGAAAP